MPTVKDSIVITLKDSTSALPTPTYGEIIVVGEDTDDFAKFNTVYTFYSQAEAEAEFGASSPICKATAKIFAQGVAHVKAVNTCDSVTPTYDYATVLAALVSDEVDYDIIVPTIEPSDTNAGALVSHANTYSKVLVLADIDTQANVETNFGALTANEWVYAVAHDSTYTAAELAGAAAGAIANIKNWIPAEWQSVSGITAAGYTPSEISSIETANINVPITVGSSVVLSAGKALSGAWLDISRTKQYLVDLIEQDLANLKLRKAGEGQKITYSPAGLNLVRSTLVQSCKRAQEAGALRESYIEDGQLIEGYSVFVPDYDSISQSDKDARTLNNVTVTAYLSGAISVIKLDLVVSL